MLSYSLLGNRLGAVARTGSAVQAQQAAGGIAPATYAVPNVPGPTLSIGPFTLDQDQINSLSATTAVTIPVGRLSSTLSDPSYVPADWAPFLRTVLFQPWAGTTAAGVNNNFGNYWFNDTYPSDHFDPASQNMPPPIVHTIAWASEPIKQQSYRDWMTALGIGPDEDYFMPMISVVSTGTAYFDPSGWYNHQPVATFTNPNDNQLYGIWIQLTARDTTIANTFKPTTSFFQTIKQWPVPQGGFDSPFDMDLIIASATLANSYKPVNTSIFQYFNPANWVGYLKTIWNDVVAPISCDVIRGLPPGAAGQKALAATGWVGTAVALTSLFAQCGVTQTPDCSNPANATNPVCAKTQPSVVVAAVPWYTTWWGIGLIAMIGIGGVLIVRSRSAPHALSGPRRRRRKAS